MTCCNGNGWYNSFSGGVEHAQPCPDCNPQGLAAEIWRQAAIDKAIATFNFNPTFDDYDGQKIAHHARRPILATDCDYEIVRISGVQGMRI